MNSSIEIIALTILINDLRKSRPCYRLGGEAIPVIFRRYMEGTKLGVVLKMSIEGLDKVEESSA